jgi:hypothetical protein
VPDYAVAAVRASADNNVNTSDPRQVLLDQHFSEQSGDTFTLAISSAVPVIDASVRTRVAAALTPLRAAPHVSGVSDPYAHVSRDGHIAFAAVQFNELDTAIPTGEIRIRPRAGEPLSSVIEFAGGEE